MAGLLSAADVACFPYDEDTRCSSGALHRTIGVGTPVVATRIPKFHELGAISDEILVRPGCSEHLAGVLTHLLQDTRFRRFVRERTEKFARDTAWERVARMHVSLYCEVARSRVPRRVAG